MASSIKGDREAKHKSYAGNAKIRLAKRKDRNVKRSSHGKYQTVAELVAHQTTVSKQPRKSTVKVAAPVAA